MDSERTEIFFAIHQDLPREGPGDGESTRRAFALLTALSKQPLILDIGCGPGMQTLDLIQLTEGTIVAVDNHQPFLGTLNKKILAQNLADRIHLVKADMFELGFAEKIFNLIWAEGSIYIIGFARGLQTWRPLLKEGGYLAVTELTWLKPDPPQEVKGFWREGYPAMQDVAANLKIITDAGYQPLGHFTLPQSAWWAEYYTPMEKRIAMLREKYAGNAKAIALLAMEQREIDLYREYADYYGYVFYLMQVR